MPTFSYKDNFSPSGPKEIFSCQADDILKADSAFTTATGINPSKAPHISCAITFEKVTYQFTCPACKKLQAKPGWCLTCAAEANAFYDSLNQQNPTYHELH